MPETLYCWRCRFDVPMLSDDEWATLSPLLADSARRIGAWQAQHGCSLAEALEKGLGDALAAYERLTGFKETNPNALWHHRRSLYGPACQACGKPLRTPQARSCAMCGAPRAADDASPSSRALGP
jgi:hypothetical protein